MNISLDWDGTVTAESTGFANFVNDMRALGHKVYIVTMRYPSECVRDPMMRRWAHGVDGIIPTSRRAKKEVLDELNIKAHIYIDDHPEAVNKSAAELWDKPSPEGTVFIVDQVTGENVLMELDDPEDESLIDAMEKVREKLLLPPPPKLSPAIAVNNTSSVPSSLDGKGYRVKLGVFGVTGSQGNFIPPLTEETLQNKKQWPVVESGVCSLRAMKDFSIPFDLVVGRVSNLTATMVEGVQEVYGDLVVFNNDSFLNKALQEENLELQFGPYYLKDANGVFHSLIGWGVSVVTP
jgi:hypothetical protein